MESHGVFAFFCLYYVINITCRIFCITITVQLQIYMFSIKINLSDISSPHCTYLFFIKASKFSRKVLLAHSCWAILPTRIASVLSLMSSMLPVKIFDLLIVAAFFVIAAHDASSTLYIWLSLRRSFMGPAKKLFPATSCFQYYSQAYKTYVTSSQNGTAEGNVHVLNSFLIIIAQGNVFSFFT